MTPLLLKSLLLATLVICFVPSTFTENVVDIDCSSFKNAGKKCPDFCPNTRIQKMNPSSAYGALCVCCDSDISDEDESEEGEGNEATENKEVFELPLEEKPQKPKEVSDENRKAVLNVLRDLVKDRKLPHLEFKFWEIKIHQTNKYLLTREEEDLLLMLLMDCEVPWNNAFLLVHPLAGDKNVAKKELFGLRSSLFDFGAGPEEKEESSDDLKKELLNLQFGKAEKKSST